MRAGERLNKTAGMFAGKIFGVGLNKSGTSSLAEACHILGFDAMHHEIVAWPSDEISRAVQRNVEAGLGPLNGMREVRAHDAFFDVRAVEKHFVALDAHHPDSRFILHVRDLDSWLDSRENHVRRQAVAAKAGGAGSQWLTVDREAWAEEWHKQQETVRSYFEGREEMLLEIDVVNGDGWEKLAPFLGCSVPSVAFPHQNRARRLVWQRFLSVGARTRRLMLSWPQPSDDERA